MFFVSRRQHALIGCGEKTRKRGTVDKKKIETRTGNRKEDTKLGIVEERDNDSTPGGKRSRQRPSSENTVSTEKDM